jgi:hypothetical protein
MERVWTKNKIHIAKAINPNTAKVNPSLPTVVDNDPVGIPNPISRPPPIMRIEEMEKKINEVAIAFARASCRLHSISRLEYLKE